MHAAHDHFEADHHSGVLAYQQAGGRCQDGNLDPCVARVAQSSCSQIDRELAQGVHLAVGDKSLSRRGHRGAPARVRRFVFGRAAVLRQGRAAGRSRAERAEPPQPRVQRPAQGLAQEGGGPSQPWVARALRARQQAPRLVPAALRLWPQRACGLRGLWLRRLAAPAARALARSPAGGRATLQKRGCHHSPDLWVWGPGVVR